MSQVWKFIDGVRVNILKDWRHNPITTTQRASLAASLNSAHVGLQCFDTDELLNYYWNGTAWTSGVAQVPNVMTFKGAYTNLTTAPAVSAVGDTYILNATGTLTWAGITFSPSAVVQPGDLIIKRTATLWDVVEGNNVAASETVSGNIQIATQAIVTTGTDDTMAITPLKLKTAITNQGLSKTYFASSVTLVANTAFTVAHNLALQNKDAFVISVKDTAGSEVDLDVDSVDTNSLTIKSSIAATGVKVMVVGR